VTGVAWLTTFQCVVFLCILWPPVPWSSLFAGWTLWLRDGRAGRAGSLTGLIEGCLNVARHGGCHGWAWVVVVVRVCLWLSCRQQDRQVGLGSESQDWGGVWSAQADAQPAHGAMGHREGTGRAVCDVLIGILNIALPWSPPMLSDVCSGKSSGG